MSNARPGFESGSTERLFNFSDAVVAIAITLLALALPVPEGHTIHTLWSSVRHDDDEYLAFLISFVVIANAWSQHHHLFRYVQRTDARLRTLNMIWLLTIVLNPFATKLLTFEGNDTLPAHALRFGFYALLQVIANAAIFVMVRHMVSRGLQGPDAPERLTIDTYWQSFGVILGFGLSIPLFFATSEAWVLWIVGPVLAGQISLRRHRARGSNRGG